jgi:hypothetical protein
MQHDGLEAAVSRYQEISFIKIPQLRSDASSIRSAELLGYRNNFLILIIYLMLSYIKRVSTELQYRNSALFSYFFAAKVHLAAFFGSLATL